MGIKYEVDGDDLTAIANKIRTKGGTSSQLSFPTGFEDAVDAIQTGITPTGTKNISTNGTHDVTNYASANVAVPASAVDSGTKNINSNGTHDVVGYASAAVNVPNTYSQSDEGKVVQSGALVSQSSQTVTENGTVDTTLINSLLVNVAGSTVQHFQYTQTENWNSAGAGGTTKNFVAVYCTKGAGYYYAKIQNTNTAGQAGQEVTYYSTETFLNQGAGGKSRRNSGYYNTMQNDVYFYIGSGSTIDLYFLPVGELMPS